MYPFKPESNRHVALWGDSLTDQVSPYLRLVTLEEVMNCGVGGQTSTQILGRFVVAPPEQITTNAMVIWAGRNNYSDPVTVKADIASMVAQAPANYLVLSILNGSQETLGNTGYNFITALNADLAALYGSHYYDLRSYLVMQHDQSAQDLTDFANDTVPTSLRSDAIHLNATGYTLAAAQIKAKLGI